MSSIIVTLSSLFNHYLLKNVDTGDKTFDNAIIGMLALSFSSFILYVNGMFSMKMLNWLKYKLWYRHKNPFDFKKSWYYHERYAIIKNYNRIELYIATAKEVTSFLEKFVFQNRNDDIIDEENRPFLVFNAKSNRVDSSASLFPIYYKGNDIVYASIGSSLYIYSKSLDSIQDMLGYINIQINNNNESNDNDNHIYEYSNNTMNKIGKIGKRKTFDKLFYSEKDTLHATIDRFSKGELYPKTVGMDNKLGILLYGPPGTGKTGTILAIANQLQRSVITVNFSKITKKSDLDFVLSSVYTMRNIYVFDEFDCILNVLTNKKQTVEPEKPSIDWGNVLTVSNEEERKEILKMMRESITKKESDDIDLGYLLSKLDGLEDSSGRIIIATTNHPENINPALLRPGRFDMKLCLGNCTHQMYSDILKSYFTTVDIEKIRKLKEKQWSPLEVYNCALMTNDFNKTIELLMK
jgi:AAA+ superfamily predicted ATPase